MAQFYTRLLIMVLFFVLVMPTLAREPRRFPADSFVLDSLNRPIFIADTDILTLIRCDNPDCTSHTDIQFAGISIANPRQMARLALTRLEHLVLAYATDAHLINLIVCNDPACDTYTSTIVDGVLASHEFSLPNLALDSVDYPVLSYFDSQAQGIKLVYCGDKLCQSRRTTVISQGITVTAMTMMLDNRDNPIIAFRDAANTLNLLACDSLLCEAPKVQILDDTRPIGDFFSIILNEQNIPAVAYMDSAANTLHLATCDTAACKTPVSAPIANPTNLVNPPLLTLSPLGLPMLFFAEANALNVVLCNDAVCTQPTINPLGLEIVGNAIIGQSYDEDGNDVLLFMDAEKRLTLLRCNDGRCTAPQLQVINP
jgi:hypothetical protein